MVHLLNRIKESNLFNNFIIFVIVFAGILVGLETYPSVVKKYGHVIHLLDVVVIAIFILEIIIKMGAEGRKPWQYFFDPWNVFDFCIVAVVLLPVDANFVAVLRLARIFRVFRLVTQLPKLQMVVGTLIKSIPSMGYVTLLMILLFYIYATIGTFMFGKNDPMHFGTLQLSTLSLFRAVTLEDWTDLMYTQMYSSDMYGYDGCSEVDREPKAFPIFGAIYFVSFILFGPMIIINLFIGIIMNSMMELREEKDDEDAQFTKDQPRDVALAHEIRLLVHQARLPQ